MSQSNLIKLFPPALPANYCFTTAQTFANDLINGTRIVMQSDIGNYFYHIGEAPSGDLADRSFPWLRTVSGAPEGWYRFFSGGWYRLHPIAANSPERRLWTSTLVALQSYDGGDGTAANPSSATGGPMWRVDEDLSGKMPVGADDTLLLGATGGEKTHVLTMDELPADGVGLSALKRFTSFGDGGGTGGLTIEPSIGVPISQQTNDLGIGSAHENMPPYRVVYFIKRTERLYIKGG